MSFKMKGSPAKMGGIQGTTGHASALKKVEWNDKLTRKTEKRKRLEERLEKREGKNKNTDRINRRIDKNQDKINEEYYKLNPKKTGKTQKSTEAKPVKGADGSTEKRVYRGTFKSPTKYHDGTHHETEVPSKTDEWNTGPEKTLEELGAENTKNAGKKSAKKVGTMVEKKLVKKVVKNSRTKLSNKDEDKRNKLINKRTDLKDDGKEKETSGKLRRTQNKINKIDGSNVRHKKGFLGLGEYKKVRKD